MSTESLNHVERVPLVQCPNWATLGQCIFRFIKKAVQFIPELLTFDAEAIFESKDWPYLWKTK
jgi:hypothetical protein